MLLLGSKFPGTLLEIIPPPGHMYIPNLRIPFSNGLGFREFRVQGLG